VPKTLLAVDDSATMRKVLEITFAGDDFRVVTADGASSALGRMGDEPSAVVIDTALGGDDGYALAKEMRTRSGRLAVIMLASRYNPYDPNRGREAGVDDFIDKPFDTQMLIDKVKKAVGVREAARPAPQAAAPAPAPAAMSSFATTAAFGSASRAPAIPITAAPATPAAKPVSPAASVPRTHTLSFEGALPIVPAPVAAAAPAPSRHVPPVQAPAAPNPPVPPSPAASYTASAHHAPAAAAAPAPTHSAPSTGHTAMSAPTSVYASSTVPPRAEATTFNPAPANGQFGKKLDELGLTPAQIEAVVALSRELVERVVWEVVPQIAETLIKEEIARLTKEG
jgi:CheY-like chemotaxis protein